MRKRKIQSSNQTFPRTAEAARIIHVFFLFFLVFIGSDSLSGVLSPKPHNNSTEDLVGGSFKWKQGRHRHASAEVQPWHELVCLRNSTQSLCLPVVEQIAIKDFPFRTNYLRSCNLFLLLLLLLFFRVAKLRMTTAIRHRGDTRRPAQAKKVSSWKSLYFNPGRSTASTKRPSYVTVL